MNKKSTAEAVKGKTSEDIKVILKMVVGKCVSGWRWILQTFF